jgi:hypothetical protein
VFTAEWLFIVPLTPSCASSLTLVPLVHPPTFHLLFPFFSSSLVCVAAPTIKSFLISQSARLGCSYQFCFVTNQFVRHSYCLHSFLFGFLSVFSTSSLQKMKIFGLCVVQLQSIKCGACHTRMMTSKPFLYYGLDDRGIESRFPAGGKDSSLSLASRPAVAPT